ncbi:hormonally up-regulated neu tumor-associated kinase homolog A-like isoform X2 [Acipenser ruthenus]|uniref:hormonally up-regulated neu tumor-associated kinase homolog A-like isoform X2 n=1 Tax=Acipenser ruthenus TaxID=7906 RepID=UPI002741C081|nr:hormonally up-regulated neu tumor-associated kinase homolog A-like isoform X2 [Acipenser ruthenus]
MPAAVGGMLPERNGFLGGKSHIFPGESSLPSFLSCVSKEYLRNFQHNKRVGNYLIGRKLGEGSFAKVREGLHVTTGEKVAIKVIDKKKAKKDSYVTKNLRREGQIQQMIRHPNITQLLDILETENSYYLVMELCPGGNLMHKICEKKRLEEYEAQKYIRQLVMAVEHLHRAGVVHRDLKIENLLLDEENNIKLIDFGLSNCAGILGYSDPFSTQCGSPAYAAPELLSRKKYSSKVDVWSIGVNMYAMLIGTLPFTVEPFSLRALHQKMVDKEMNPLPVHLSPAAVNMLRNLLEPDPTKRPNIQQALAEQWLNENYQGKPLYRTPYPNRIHMKELNQSVLLHMTEKLGYKHSEVVNTVISNRACHTLTAYFLLNKKLERYLRELKHFCVVFYVLTKPVKVDVSLHVPWNTWRCSLLFPEHHNPLEDKNISSRTTSVWEGKTRTPGWESVQIIPLILWIENQNILNQHPGTNLPALHSPTGFQMKNSLLPHSQNTQVQISLWFTAHM